MWDGDKKAPKADDLKSVFDARKADDERRAALPQKPEDYKTEFAKDFKLPDGWEVKADDPMWKLGKELAHKHGWTQDQLNDLATGYVQNQIGQHTALVEATKQRDASLGPNGGARVEALNTWFKGVFGDQVGAQFAQTLFTKDIIEGFEKVQSTLARQGVTSFSNVGRDGGRTDGKPANWESLSPVDRLTWTRTNQKSAA